LTKQGIIDRLVKQSGFKKREIDYIIDNFLNYIVKSVDNGEKVEIRGFGSFCRVERKGRKVYSPIAKKHIDLPAKSVMAFKASKNTNKGIKGA
jgi:integration host factor subunit beta